MLALDFGLKRDIEQPIVIFSSRLKGSNRVAQFT